jgi:hypothetical protein
MTTIKLSGAAFVALGIIGLVSTIAGRADSAGSCTREKARAAALEYIAAATALPDLSDATRAELRNVLAPLADVAGCDN